LTSSSHEDTRIDELRSLRDLITYPTQKALDDLQRVLVRLHREVHTPDELTKLLVPVITEVLRKKILADEHEVATALATIIDKAFHEKTQHDKAAIVDALAPSVAKALREQHDRFPAEVAEDLAPLMGAAIREQVRLQKDAMVDALYPIIGSTIAKYMAEALRDLVDNVNRRIEQTLSFQGYMRRIKAKATGISEAELILKESLPFSVSAVFLIHKASGILIAQAHDEQGSKMDATLVSGMLTAIRSFVNDWIARAGEMSELDSIEYGRSQILLEAAGHCYLAVVVDGEPSDDFVVRTRQTLSDIVAEWDKEIATFAGDQTSIPPKLVERLRLLIMPGVAATGSNQARKLRVTPLIVILTLLAGIPLAWHFYQNNQNQRMQERISAAIGSSLEFEKSPIQVIADGDEVELVGTLPNKLLLQRTLETAKRVSPESRVQSSILVAAPPVHEAITKADIDRVAAAFNALSGVNISASYRNGLIVVTGYLSDSSLAHDIRRSFERLPGVSSLTFSANSILPSIQQIIYFEDSGFEIVETEHAKLDSIKLTLQRFNDMRIRIVGHSDIRGSNESKLIISRRRAEAVKEFLVAWGIAAQRLVTEGSGAPVPRYDPEIAENRCVRFEILQPNVIKEK
jgi:outer membrane protein OmpA-like peptidoglycan-associated protein